jgi:hypothetical protein
MQLARAWMLQHRFDLHTLLVQSGITLAVMAVLAFALGWLVAGRSCGRYAPSPPPPGRSPPPACTSGSP